MIDFSLIGSTPKENKKFLVDLSDLREFCQDSGKSLEDCVRKMEELTLHEHFLQYPTKYIVFERQKMEKYL